MFVRISPKKEVSLWALAFTLSIISAAGQQKNDSAQTEQKPRESYYIEAGSYATKRESDPPSYVRNLGKSEISGVNKATWLDAGLIHRTRFEYRKNDIRRPESVNIDYPILFKSHLYLGVKNILDPFRIALEIGDSFRKNGKYPLDDRDVNRFELIQGYGELYFKKAFGTDALGNSRPLSIRGGRMAFEFLDRRLIASNQWRNTTNNFLGFRASLGQEKNDWQIDILALRPVIRLINKFDKTDPDKDFGAAIFHWRKWSEIITIEPYYLGLKQRPSPANNNRERLIHSPGIRLYGWTGNKHLNYDFTYTRQFGEDNKQFQRAYMITGEAGYTLREHSWKPRVSLFYGYVTGDKNPSDNENNRFERFYGFARPWSSDDYIIPENIVVPKIKIELEPAKNLKADGGYSYYWLESATDRFNNLLAGSPVNRDKTGKSGTFLGHGFDSRIRLKPASFLDLNIGYTHFVLGEFVKSRQITENGETAAASDFFYFELSFNVSDLAFFSKKKSN